MRLLKRLAAVAAIAAVAVLAVAAPAGAHNYLVSSTPSSGDTLTALPARFSVTTNGILPNLNKNGSGFALLVRDKAGLYYGDGCVTVAGAGISVPAVIGKPGAYTVTWQVISTDGHIVSDSFPFMWAPSGVAKVSAGSSKVPDCHGRVHPNATGAAQGTGSTTVSGDTLATILWIGGAVLAVGAAVIVMLLVTSRRRRT